MISEVICEAAIKKYGAEKQTDMVIEEVGEFLQAWNKYKRGLITYEEYIEEMVDCYVMFSQMRYMHRSTFDKIMDRKIARLTKKLFGD
jgi:NTP pyrophosphatase (non-canonical NTP hydrolase)